MGYKSATAALGETCTHWRICILNGRDWIHGSFACKFLSGLSKLKQHIFLTSVVCVYPPRVFPKTLGVSERKPEAFWCWQKITSHQLHQAGRKHGRSIGRWYRKVPHIFPHNFTRFSQGAQRIKSASLLCEIWGIFPAVFWPGGSEPDLWGEWLLLWRPIRSPVRWATVAKANLRQGGWNEGKRQEAMLPTLNTC